MKCVHNFTSSSFGCVSYESKKRKSQVNMPNPYQRSGSLITIGIDAFYGAENVDIHNVDMMTDVSGPGTTFTRYTKAPTTASRATKRVKLSGDFKSLLNDSHRLSSRSKRKMERKIGSGRKGTIDEEEYLLTSISKLVTRFIATQGYCYSYNPLVAGLMMHTQEMRIVCCRICSNSQTHIGRRP
jgi:hypothetical protein